MDKSIIFTQVLTLFLMMLVGFAARRLKYLNTEVNKGLTSLLLNITAPFMAMASFQFAFSPQMLREAGIVFVFAFAAHLLTIFLGKLLFFPISGDNGKVLRFAAIFSNCGFMGYPIAASLFGERGVFFTSVYVAVFHLFIWTYGAFIFKGKMDRDALKNALLNPGVIAVFIGMFMFLFSIKLPVALAQTLQIVGSMTTPLSMIIVGALLADIKPADLFSGFSIYYGAVVRLLVIPLLGLAVLRWFGFEGILLGVCVMTLAMPVAAMTVPLAEQNNGDTIFSSRIVFISTIFSIVTIPMVLLLI
ncbi:MAG TPA: AEC family transporter [Bacillota bacterium]|nr:AEC family transporter [Bacillota bacterium]